MKPPKKKNKRSIPHPPSRLDNIPGNEKAYRSRPQLIADCLELAKVVSIQDRTIKYWADIVGYPVGGDGVRLMRRRAQEKDYDLSPLEQRREDLGKALLRFKAAQAWFDYTAVWWRRIIYYKRFDEARNEWVAAEIQARMVLADTRMGFMKG